MKCSRCGNEIPEARLKAIPKTETCVNCSEVEKVAGFRIITGKSTYTELEITTQKRCKYLNSMQSRGGSISRGVSMQSYAMANRSEAARLGHISAEEIEKEKIKKKKQYIEEAKRNKILNNNKV